MNRPVTIEARVTATVQVPTDRDGQEAYEYAAAMLEDHNPDIDGVMFGEVVEDGRPSLDDLDRGGVDLEGVAVRDPDLGGGEVTNHGVGEVFVEFGDAGREKWVDADVLDIDWSYYRENPGHATAAVAPYIPDADTAAE